MEIPIRLQEEVTIKGFLEDETTYSALLKKRNIRKLMQTQIVTGVTLSLTWDSADADQPYQCNIIKAQIAETAGGLGDSQDTKRYEITIQFMLGDYKG